MLGYKYLYWRQQKIHKIKNSESSSCLPLDHRSGLYHLNTNTFSPWEWSNTVIDCPEKSRSLPSCKCSKPDWTQAWATCFSWPCFGRGVRLGDLKKLLPTFTILWFWDPLPRVPTRKRKLGCSKTAEAPDALLPVLGAWEGSCVLEKHWCWGSRQWVLPCHRGRLRAEWEESLSAAWKGHVCGAGIWEGRDGAVWLVLGTHRRALICECSTRGAEEYSWQQAFRGIWKSFETINKENSSCLLHCKSSGSTLSTSWVNYPESLNCVFKLNCIMISLYDWRERGEVWPSKNKHAPDGEKDRAGAAAGLASVTAPGALSKILFSWVSPLWKSLEELRGWGHSRKETLSVQRHCTTCMNGTAAFVRFR